MDDAAPTAPVEVTVRNLQEYLDQVAPVLRDNFEAAIDQISDLNFFCEDFKLSRTDLAWTTRGEGEERVELGWFDMPLAWLFEAGVPRVLLEYSGGYTLREPINSAIFLSRWIEIRGGSYCLWHFLSQRFINPDEPTVIYLS